MFETLFKYPADVYGRGELVFAPLPGNLGGAAMLVGGLLVASLAASLLLPHGRALGAGRRLVIGGLQGLFAAGALLVLARPAMEVATLAPGVNTVAVLLDVSESMGFAAGPGQGSRLAAAETAVTQALIPGLSRTSEVATFTFGRAAQRQSLGGLAPDEPRTRLLRSLDDVLTSFGGAPLAAVVVVSDGADNGADGADLARLSSRGVPVHTVGVGPLVVDGEVRISEVTLPAEAPPASRVVGEVVIAHTAEGPAAVKVFDGSRLVALRELNLDRNTPAQRVAVALDSGPGGIRELSFVVEPPPGDVLPGNNRVERLLTVGERRRRVLYLEGEPRWEYKFIRRAVGGDEVLTLTSWLRTTQRKTYSQEAGEPEDLDGGFPASRAALYRYDVVVLGSLAATYLGDEQHRWLETFVSERGGSVLALAGREALADGGWDVVPLADALPVRLRRGSPGYGPADGTVRVTAPGLRSPITQLLTGEGADPWASLPPLGDHHRLGGLKPAAATLLEFVADGEPRPLLVTQPYGLGTAAVLATATTWRWQMRTPAGDQRHTLFWRQLLRQLGESAPQQRELTFEVHGDAVEVRLVERTPTFAPHPGVRAEAQVTGPGAEGERLELTASEQPGVLTGRYHPTADGVYRIDVQVAGEDAPLTRFVRLGAERQEQFQPAQNQALLRRIAAATGGRYWRLDEAGAIGESLVFASSGVRRSERLPLWDMPAAFLLLVVLKSSEWLLRRRWGRL